MRKVAAIILIVSAGSCWAQNSATAADSYLFIQELLQISQIKDAQQRLAAYDSFAAMQLPSASLSLSSSESKWSIDSGKNPLNDSNRIVFALEADQGTGIYRDPVYLVVRYDSSETEIYINWQSYLGSEANVTIRFDKDDAGTSAWTVSTDSKSSFYSGNPMDFVRRLATAGTLIARVTPYQENPITAIFDVRGFRIAANTYMSELKWWEVTTSSSYY